MKLGMSYARCGYSNIEPPALVRLRFSVSADGKTAESAYQRNVTNGMIGKHTRPKVFSSKVKYLRV